MYGFCWKRHRLISSGVTPGRVPTRETSHSSLKRNFRSFGCASAGIVMSTGGATSVLLLYGRQAVLNDCFYPSKITPEPAADSRSPGGRKRFELPSRSRRKRCRVTLREQPPT